jgi:hypothetical protein
MSIRNFEMAKWGTGGRGEQEEKMRMLNLMGRIELGELDLLEQAMKRAKKTTAEMPRDPVLWGWRPGFVARTAL